ncbi:MAG: hypothetical protein K6T83_14670 [Alicyclobacillus sp.]|nr:hypothetical protein [Alicyclobacillus sp.]
MKPMSKQWIVKAFLSVVIGTSSLGATATAFASDKTSTLDKLVNELVQLHTALEANPAGLEAVRTVEGELQTADWDKLVYGQSGSLDIPQAKLANTVGQLVDLATYANGSSYDAAESTKTKVLDAFVALNDPKLGTDPTQIENILYDFFEKFKSDLEGEVLTSGALQSPSGSFTSLVDQALESATSVDGGVLKDFLGEYGLSVNDLATIRQRISSTYDTDNTALDALIMAEASTKLQQLPDVTMTEGQTQVFHLKTGTIDGYPLLSDVPLPAGLVTWESSDSKIASIDPTSGVVTAHYEQGTVTITAKIHDYPVQRFKITVSPASSSGPSPSPNPPSGTGSQTPPTGDVATVAGTTVVLGTQSVSSSGGTYTVNTKGGTIQINVPAGAFSTDETITFSESTDLNTVQNAVGDQLPTGFIVKLVIGISFSGDAPKVPITVTINDPSIIAGSKVYKVVPDGLTPMDVLVINGQAKISFSTDPYFVIASKAVTAHKPQGPKKGPKVQITEKVIYLGGKKVAVVPGFTYHETTYVPIWYVMHDGLNKLGFKTSWNGQTLSIIAPKNIHVNLTKLKPGKGPESIKLNGKVVENVTAFAEIDPNNHQYTAYMPIWYIMQALKRAGVDSKWNGTDWHLSWAKTTKK